MEKNITDSIIRYETGFMSHDEVVPFFQALINNGMAWSLQGHYGRTATRLIDCGMCYR
jgi:hypothetical protein